MKKITFYAGLVLAAAILNPLLALKKSEAAEEPFQAWLQSATVKIFPDQKPSEDSLRRMEITAVRNEYAPFQAAVTASKDISGVQVAVGDLIGGQGKIQVSQADLYLVENVTIEKPSTFAVRKVWPDPLPPYHDFDLKAGVTRAVWVDLFVGPDVQPGTYQGNVVVKTPADGDKTLALILHVKDIAIPDKPNIKTAFGIGYGSIREAHNIAKGSPEEKALDDAYYWFLVRHRLSPYFIPVDFYSEEAHMYLDDPRVTFLRSPYSENKEEMQKIVDRLKSTGWIKKAVFYVIDEPPPSRFPAVARVGQWIHSFDPDLQYLITTGYTPALKDAHIKIWSPVIAYTVEPNGMKGLRKEMENGKEFWWYTCIGPKWDGTNYFIDEYATAPRLHPWMNFLYGVTGILYWQTTHWSDVDNNPWAKTETYPGGNGDGSLLYPGSQAGYNGPVASIRLKMLREGMEDYEVLTVLGEKLRRAAAEIGGPALQYDPKSRLFEHAFALIRSQGRSFPLGSRTPYLLYVTTDYKEVESEHEKVLAEIDQALEPPLILTATDPVDHGYTKKDYAAVTGFAQAGTGITINGIPVQVSDNQFALRVPLQTGENIIRIVADREGAEKTIERTIYRQ